MLEREHVDDGWHILEEQLQKWFEYWENHWTRLPAGGWRSNKGWCIVSACARWAWDWHGWAFQLAVSSISSGLCHGRCCTIVGRFFHLQHLVQSDVHSGDLHIGIGRVCSLSCETWLCCSVEGSYSCFGRWMDCHAHRIWTYVPSKFWQSFLIY